MTAIVEQDCQGLLGRQSLDFRGTKESLTERTLGVGIDQQHLEAKLGQAARQMKTSRTLAATALLIDETECRRHRSPNAA
jgi:hypothetical protein